MQCRVEAVGCTMSDAGCRVQYARPRAEGRKQEAGGAVCNMQNPKPKTLNPQP